MVPISARLLSPLRRTGEKLEATLPSCSQGLAVHLLSVGASASHRASTVWITTNEWAVEAVSGLEKSFKGIIK
jgi:hypothetical protein